MPSAAGGNIERNTLAQLAWQIERTRGLPAQNRSGNQDQKQHEMFRQSDYIISTTICLYFKSNEYASSQINIHQVK